HARAPQGQRRSLPESGQTQVNRRHHDANIHDPLREMPVSGVFDECFSNNSSYLFSYVFISDMMASSFPLSLLRQNHGCTSIKVPIGIGSSFFSCHGI